MSITGNVKQLLDIALNIEAHELMGEERYETKKFTTDSANPYTLILDVVHFSDECHTMIEISLQSKETRHTNLSIIKISKDSECEPEIFVSNSDSSLFINKSNLSQLDLEIETMTARIEMIKGINSIKDKLIDKILSLNVQCDSINKDMVEAERKLREAQRDELIANYPEYTKEQREKALERLNSGEDIGFYVIYKHSLTANKITLKIVDGEYYINGKKKDKEKALSHLINGSRYKK